MYQERVIEEGRAHLTSVISLLTCNNTTSCSRDPCIVSRSMGSRSRRRGGGGRERMGPTVEEERGRGPEGRGVYGSILIIVPVIPERSRRVNDFCISPDRSLCVSRSLLLLPSFYPRGWRPAVYRIVSLNLVALHQRKVSRRCSIRFRFVIIIKFIIKFSPLNSF